ncbi:DUF2807 domain-containing protein [Aquimarina sp. RZ0]|uniref:GIN domain-containing protein n=1 Tax=Aquimarina sp. RZ0 TaxID=2607730 RepID=UPI0011F3EAC4|nr:DUF2807 domain-containing protein [Aquimarina sp. RZ0]KAA1244255.1 hypothetical protein F0000_17185 [Aquimarina sp. RZ0]
MKKIFISLCIVFVFGNGYAQKEKIKGNKIVITEQRSLDPFHSIEVHDNFEISLIEDTDNIVTIEADSNLQEFIAVEVHDSILEIKSKKNIKRSKKLNIRISYAQELKKILVYNKVQLKSASLLKSTNLRVESNDETEVFLSIESANLTSIINDKSTIDLHATTSEAFYQINDNAELKGILATDILKIDLYQKASAKLEGEATSMKLRTDSNTDFYGQKLKTNTASVTAEGSSDSYILCDKQITINAIDTAEIYVLGEEDLKIDITAFANEAILYRKKSDYGPGLLK